MRAAFWTSCLAISSIAIWANASEVRLEPDATVRQDSLAFSFTNIARQAGLDARTVYGGEKANTYLLETTGCGAAALDYDGDGWLDIFLVNGTVLEGLPKGQEPTTTCTGTRETARSKTSPREPGWRKADGDRARAPAITITTETTTCS